MTVVGSVLWWMQNCVCHYKVQMFLPFEHCNLFLVFALKAAEFVSITNSLIGCYLGLSRFFAEWNYRVSCVLML